MSKIDRRSALGAAATAGLGLAAGSRAAADPRPAMAGGEPVRKGAWPSWPVIGENEEKTWMEVLRRKLWFRYNGTYVRDFETRWAQQLGARHAVAVNSGTSALLTSLAALGIGPGDEVIVPPYTFLATVNAVLVHHALPVFADSELETFQVDARKMAAAVTPNTACLLPVHLGGAAADMDAILALGKERGIPVLEDTCQSHLGEWRGKKLGTLGDLGCFSFQASKNLNSGEGGAIATQRSDLYEKCMAFQNQGFPPAGSMHAQPGVGCNLRMTEFQGALLGEQLTRLEEQARRRDANGAYLTSLLKEIPGIHPTRLHPGCTRNAYHLYMFRYDPAGFADLPRATFLRALAAEGIPGSGGYTPLHRQAFLKNTLAGKGFTRIYGARRLAEWHERNQCPVNDQLCQQAVWFSQNMLLAERRDMEIIAEAIRKIQRSAATLRGQ